MSFLFERSDFGNLITLASTRLHIANPAIVEKDYYVTEALRQIATSFGDITLFKGGTSLSKGWKLIDRFSEDIDLYVEPLDSEAATLERLQAVADAVRSFPGFTSRTGRTETKGWDSWTEEFNYKSTVNAGDIIRPCVLLEAGVQSAAQPSECRELTSLIGEALDANNVPAITDDRPPFAMNLLHFRRTFVEKLYTVHSRAERAIKQSKPLGRDARHYYDLAMLLRQAETQTMLNSDEFGLICREYRDLTAKFYPGQVKYLPAGMNLSSSVALFPQGENRRMLQAAYEREVGNLCYGEYPAFDDVLQGFESIRNRLDVNGPNLP